MNKVPLPPYDDSTAFDNLSKNNRLGSYPQLQPLVGTVQASYAQYLAVNGEPSLVQNHTISVAAAKFLKGHYSSPPADLSHITKMRESDLPPTGVPTELRKSGVARLIDLRGG